MIAIVPRTARCRVWWADPRQEAIDELTSVLDERELERASRFHREQDRRRFLTGAWLLRRVVALELGMTPRDVPVERRCPDCSKPHGKPKIGGTSPSLHVSVSHSGNRVAVAVTTAGPLGVDVQELPSGPVEEFAQCALSPGETAALYALPERQRHAAFTTLWVRKEAVLKATGHGLRIPPDQVEVSAPGLPPSLLSWSLEIPPASVQMRDLDPGPGYVGAVAVLTDSCLIKVTGSYAADLPEAAVAVATPVAA